MTEVEKQCVSPSRRIEIHILTADTHGNDAVACAGLPCRLIVFPEGDQDVAKRDHLRKPGADRTICIGNGRNDRLMVGQAAIGIAIIGEEGGIGGDHPECHRSLSKRKRCPIAADLPDEACGDPAFLNSRKTGSRISTGPRTGKGKEDRYLPVKRRRPCRAGMPGLERPGIPAFAGVYSLKRRST